MELLPLTIIGVVIIIAILLSVIFRKMGQNPVLGYILAGFLLGPFGAWAINALLPGSFLALTFGELGFLSPTNPLIVGFSELGLFILLFYLGLELSLKDFIEAGSSAIGLALIDMAVSVGLGFAIMQLFGFSFLFSIIIGMMLFCTSTAVVVKFALDRGIIQSRAAKLAIAILILQDFLGILLLVLIKSSSSTGGDALSLGIAALVFAVSVFFAVSFLSKKVESWLVKNGFGHTEVTLYAIGVGLVVATIGNFLSLSTALGAYFAGFALAETDSGHKIKKDVGFLRDFLLVFFFVAFGTTLFFDMGTGKFVLFQVPLLLLGGIAFLVVIGAFIAHSVTCRLFGGFFGLNKEDASIAAILLIPLGEFVIIIANESGKIFSGEEASLVAPMAFLLILITVVVFQPLYGMRGLHERMFSFLPHPSKQEKKPGLKPHTSYSMKQLKIFAAYAFVTLCLAWLTMLLYTTIPDLEIPIPNSRNAIAGLIFLFFAALPITKCIAALKNIVKHART